MSDKRSGEAAAVDREGRPLQAELRSACDSVKDDTKIQILANGKAREVVDGSTVAALIASLGLDAARTIVELNGEPLERNRFEDTKLRRGARIEIAQMVGGG